MPPKNDATPPDEIFADGIGWIGLHAGVVRMEFFSFGTPGAPEGTTGPDKEPERIARQRVVMPLEGFIRSLTAMNDLVKKLESGGMIVRRPGPTAETPPQAGPRVAAPASSPNFD